MAPTRDSVAGFELVISKDWWSWRGVKTAVASLGVLEWGCCCSGRPSESVSTDVVVGTLGPELPGSAASPQLMLMVPWDRDRAKACLLLALVSGMKSFVVVAQVARQKPQVTRDALGGTEKPKTGDTMEPTRAQDEETAIPLDRIAVGKDSPASTYMAEKVAVTPSLPTRLTTAVKALLPKLAPMQHTAPRTAVAEQVMTRPAISAP